MAPSVVSPAKNPGTSRTGSCAGTRWLPAYGSSARVRRSDLERRR